MLQALATLLVFQTIGEVLTYALALPIPGPVLGMALLLAYLLLNERAVAALRPTCVELLKHLSLLFVPAGVGVVQNLNTLGDEGLRLVLVVVLATVIALAATALTFEYLARFMHVDENAADHDGRGAP